MKNQDLNTRRSLATPRGVGVMCDFYAVRAENATLWDVEGKEYIDFAAGIAVLNTGHRHPKIKAAVSAQLDNFTHTAYQIVPYEGYVSLAERINQRLAPIDGLKKSAFFTTGAEAVENAIKIARAATGRPGVIAFSGAFHGRTMLGMALTGKVAPYKLSFGPIPGDIYHVPFPNGTQSITVADSLKALDLLFKADIDPKRVAAIIIEPVQGEGGFNIAPARTDGGPAQALRRTRHPADRRRSADRLRPHRQAVRDGAPLRAGRPDHHGQEPGGRLAALGRGRPRRRHGRARPRAAWAAPMPATRWRWPPPTRCWT